MSTETLTNHNAAHAEHGHHDAGETKVFGFWIYLMSDCILFASLFATYAVLVNGTAGGPSGKDIFDLKFVLVETFLLLFSSITYGMAMIAMNKGKVGGVNTWLFLTFLFGLGFVAMEIYEFHHLIAEGFGLHIPKGYLYAAIGFSILIELFNQIARRNFIKHQARRPMRERTAEAIMRLMGQQRAQQTDDAVALPRDETFAAEERYMISGVLTLASRSLRSVMTPRTDISWVDCERSREEVRAQLLDTPHSLFPVCRDSVDEIVGVVRAKDLLVALEQGEDIAEFAARTPPIVVPETMDVIKLLAVLRRAKGRLVVVTNEFGVVQGLVTPLDVLEAIAGEFPDEDETPDIVAEGDSWLVKGGTDLHSLEQALACDDLVSPTADYATLAGLLLAHYGQMPVAGDSIELNHLRFDIVEVSEYRIELVRVTRVVLDETAHA